MRQSGKRHWKVGSAELLCPPTKIDCCGCSTVTILCYMLPNSCCLPLQLSLLPGCGGCVGRCHGRGCPLLTGQCDCCPVLPIILAQHADRLPGGLRGSRHTDERAAFRRRLPPVLPRAVQVRACMHGCTGCRGILHTWLRTHQHPQARVTQTTLATSATSPPPPPLARSPNSGATLDERGGCTTGCALNTVDHDDAQLAAAAASIRAEEATRAAAEAHALNKTVEGILRREDARAAAEEEQLNMSLAALKEAEDERAADEEKALKESLEDVAAAEEARAAQEEEQLRAAIDAERAFEDERAEVEAKRARQQAQKEKKRLDSVQAELTSVRGNVSLIAVGRVLARPRWHICIHALPAMWLIPPTATAACPGHSRLTRVVQDMDVLRSEVSALKDALAEQALLLTKTADTIRAEEDARADVEAEALRTSVAELTAHEDARAKAERGMRQDLAESIEELKVRALPPSPAVLPLESCGLLLSPTALFLESHVQRCPCLNMRHQGMHNHALASPDFAQQCDYRSITSCVANGLLRRRWSDSSVPWRRFVPARQTRRARPSSLRTPDPQTRAHALR